MSVVNHPYWRYRVEWREPGSPVISHPGHALFRTLEHALAHAVYLKKRGIAARVLDTS